MTIQEALTEYQYNNVGQFKGIAQSLGYKEEYNKGYLCFSRGNEKFHTTVEEIRKHTMSGKDLTAQKASMERVCKFFDRESILSYDYVESLSDKGIVLINWGDLRSDSKDRYTVIDQKNKICYTGKELYDYALKNRYLLDGKGTKLENGVLSELTDVRGKPAKIRMTKNGMSVFYRNDVLTIPDRVLGKKLTEKQRKALLEGDVIVISTKKGDKFIHVDRDLNAVVVRSEKELSIPTRIGEKELTTADKYLLANGHSLDNMIFHNEEGYFIADVSLSSDKKGVALSNVQVISEMKAKELFAKQKENDKAQDNTLEKNPVMDKDRDFESELKEAVAKDDFEKMAHLKEEGYKPSDEVIKGLSSITNMDDKKAITIEKLFGTAPEVQPSGEMEAKKSEEPVTELTEAKDSIKSATPELDSSFKAAVESGDFAKLSMMKTEGYIPTKEVMKSLSASVPENSIVAVHKIFGLKTTTPKMGEVKLAQSPQTSNKELSRGVGNMVNKAFGDL